jgi:hypothetical protein
MRGRRAFQRAEHDARRGRVAGLQRARLGDQPCDERIGDLAIDDHALGRHADLPLVEERAERDRIDRRVEIGVVEHEHGRLAAEFEQRRLQVLRGERRDDPAHARRASEVHAPHGRVRDQPLDDRRRILRRVRDHVDDAVAEPRVVQHAADQPVHARTSFEAFSTTVLPHASGIARARREDHRRIPRRDPEHHAARLAHGHRDAARHVGRNHRAVDLRRHRGGLAQHVGGEHHVEAVPVRHRAGFRAAGLDEFAGACVHPVGRRQQPAAALGRRQRRPRGNARAAAATAASASASVAAAARDATCPVAGSIRSNVPPSDAPRDTPSINKLTSCISVSPLRSGRARQRLYACRPGLMLLSSRNCLRPCSRPPSGSR